MPKVSVIIPVYNAGKYIEECIKSILSQTYEDFEILLVNDGSTDESQSICEEYTKKDNRVKLFNNENHGVSYSRNYGIDNSSGEYIMFIDADDTIRKDTIEDNVKILENNNASVVFSGFIYHIMDTGEVKNNPLPEFFAGSKQEFMDKWFIECLNRECLNPPWNKLIRKSVIVENNIRFNEEFSICEDMAFSMELIDVSDRIAVSEKEYYNYFIKSTGSLVFKFHNNYFEALSYYYDAATKLVNSSANNKENSIAIDNVYVNLGVMYIKLISNNKTFDFKEKSRRFDLIRNNEKFAKAFSRVDLTKKKKLVKRLLYGKHYKMLSFLYNL